MRNINLVFFSLFLTIIVLLPIVCVDRFRSNPDVPWQLVPFGADSLSQAYRIQYQIMDLHALSTQLKNSSRTTAMVLIDGWGIPYDEKMLEDDFDLLKGTNATFVMHKRLLGHTSHAENVEYRFGFTEGVLLADGDSSTCKKIDSEQGDHFKETICCENCKDKQILAMLDSLVAHSTLNKVAWTVRSTREGDREKLHEVLRGLSDVVSRHPDVQFIIQGTHRPILGTPETRRKYLAPWVPAVFINCELKESSKK